MDQLVEIKSKIQINPSRVGKKYFIKTFGCQMNEHDSERISGMFELDGMSKACTIGLPFEIAFALDININ